MSAVDPLKARVQGHEEEEQRLCNDGRSLIGQNIHVQVCGRDRTATQEC